MWRDDKIRSGACKITVKFELEALKTAGQSHNPHPKLQPKNAQP